ncbi:hypothetical protein [Microbacterium sp. UBA3394]|uniref:hypothetical protein n=1 Tax=Microbacterium sp. UBA3394 TaxID=1946945 RepID=UPI0025808DAE|nr:hypothetical protein [Microbacterium sp. UBA3394]
MAVPPCAEGNGSRFVSSLRSSLNDQREGAARFVSSLRSSLNDQREGPRGGAPAGR